MYTDNCEHNNIFCFNSYKLILNFIISFSLFLYSFVYLRFFPLFYFLWWNHCLWNWIYWKYILFSLLHVFILMCSQFFFISVSLLKQSRFLIFHRSVLFDFDMLSLIVSDFVCLFIFNFTSSPDRHTHMTIDTLEEKSGCVDFVLNLIELLL